MLTSPFYIWRLHRRFAWWTQPAWHSWIYHNENPRTNGWVQLLTYLYRHNKYCAFDIKHLQTCVEDMSKWLEWRCDSKTLEHTVYNLRSTIVIIGYTGKIFGKPSTTKTSVADFSPCTCEKSLSYWWQFGSQAANTKVFFVFFYLRNYSTLVVCHISTQWNHLPME